MNTRSLSFFLGVATVLSIGCSSPNNENEPLMCGGQEVGPAEVCFSFSVENNAVNFEGGLNSAQGFLFYGIDEERGGMLDGCDYSPHSMTCRILLSKSQYDSARVNVFFPEQERPYAYPSFWWGYTAKINEAPQCVSHEWLNDSVFESVVANGRLTMANNGKSVRFRLIDNGHNKSDCVDYVDAHPIE